MESLAAILVSLLCALSGKLSGLLRIAQGRATDGARTAVHEPIFVPTRRAGEDGAAGGIGDVIHWLVVKPKVQHLDPPACNVMTRLQGWAGARARRQGQYSASTPKR
jgi:hypothetical protein